MGTEKRERQKANKAARQAALEAAEARKRRLKFIRNVVVLVIAIIVVGFLLAGCSDSDSAGGDDVETVGEASGQGTADGGASYGSTACPPAEGVEEPQIDFDEGFEQCIDLDKSYEAVIETTEGTVTVALDTERTPITTNNFVALARYGYYDDTDLFRTEAATGIIQGGSPHTQDNSDPGPGPGFSVPDEGLPFSADDYGPGTLAMARTAEPNSASGQFFLLASEGGRYLGDPAQVGDSAGSYAVFGTATEGLDVLAAIAALDDGSGVPSAPVSIVTVTITES